MRILILFIMLASGFGFGTLHALETDSLATAPTDVIIEHAFRHGDMGMLAEKSAILEALMRMDRKLDETQRVRTLYGLAHSYYASGVYQRAIANLFELLQTEKPAHLAYYDALARLILSDIYVRFDSPEKAAASLEKARKSLDAAPVDKAKHDEIMQRIHQQWSSVYGMREEWDKFLEALRLADSLGEHTEADRVRRMLDYGIYYAQTGNDPLASQYFERVIERREWSYDKMAAYCNYAQMVLDAGNCRRAAELADRGLAEMDAGGGTGEMRAELLHVKGLALDCTGNPAEAVRLLEKSRQINDSIMKWHSAHSILQACRDYEMALDSADRAARERARRRQLAVSAGVAVLGLISVMVAVGMWYRSRRHRRYGLSLEKLILEQRDSYDSRISDTMEDLERKQRNLMSVTLKMSQLGEVVENALSGTVADDHDAAGRLETLRADVKRIGLNRNVWEMFDVVFEQTNPGFYKALRDRHPDLTAGEMRMCAYIIMNLGTKEIAVMTNRSARTVETVRYRLGKKISPPPGIGLADYLRGLSGN